TTTEGVEVNAPSTEAVTYTVDAQNSLINWEGGKVTGDKHLGTIALKEGQVSVADGKVTNGKFVIDMNSINVTDITDAEKKAMLEGHLKGATAERSEERRVGKSRKLGSRRNSRKRKGAQGDH